jgi:hypothetical protein
LVEGVSESQLAAYNDQGPRRDVGSEAVSNNLEVADRVGCFVDAEKRLGSKKLSKGLSSEAYVFARER